MSYNDASGQYWLSLSSICLNISKETFLVVFSSHITSSFSSFAGKRDSFNDDHVLVMVVVFCVCVYRGVNKIWTLHGNCHIACATQFQLTYEGCIVIYRTCSIRSISYFFVYLDYLCWYSASKFGIFWQILLPSTIKLVYSVVKKTLQTCFAATNTTHVQLNSR